MVGIELFEVQRQPTASRAFSIGCSICEQSPAIKHEAGKANVSWMQLGNLQEQPALPASVSRSTAACGEKQMHSLHAALHVTEAPISAYCGIRTARNMRNRREHHKNKNLSDDLHCLLGLHPSNTTYGLLLDAGRPRLQDALLIISGCLSDQSIACYELFNEFRFLWRSNLFGPGPGRRAEGLLFDSGLVWDALLREEELCFISDCTFAMGSSLTRGSDAVTGLAASCISSAACLANLFGVNLNLLGPGRGRRAGLTIFEGLDSDCSVERRRSVVPAERASPCLTMGVRRMGLAMPLSMTCRSFLFGVSLNLAFAFGAMRLLGCGELVPLFCTAN